MWNKGIGSRRIWSDAKPPAALPIAWAIVTSSPCEVLAVHHIRSFARIEALRSMADHR
jgi:hypothetical protein